MSNISSIIIRIYSTLLRLFPKGFREEFEKQMLLDFSDMVHDALKRGGLSFTLLCLRELIDYPINLLEAYWKEGRMPQILHSQPVRSSLRSALAFGLAFSGITFASWQTSNWVYSTFGAVSQVWSVWYYNVFRTENEIFLAHDILAFVWRSANSIIVGLLFAFLFGRRSKYRMYILAGALGWFIPDTVAYMFSGASGWSVYLTEGQGRVLDICILILTGTFWGAICSMVDRENKIFVRFLTTAVILYPLSTFLFLELLFALGLEIKPWFFPLLLTFVLILTSGVFAVILRYERRIPWMVIAGAVGYPILFYASFSFAYDILHFPQPDFGVSFPLNLFVIYQLYYIGFEAIFGLFFGLLLGLILGFQKKDGPPLVSIA